MFPTSPAYKTAIKGEEKNWTISIDIVTAYGTITVTGYDVVQGSFFREDNVMNQSNIAPGSAVMSSLNFSLNNQTGAFDDIVFDMARIIPKVSLEVSKWVYEDVPIGVYTVTESPYKQKTPGKPIPVIPLTCKDNIIKFEKPFKNVTVNYPVTAGNLLQAVCFYCGVTRDSSAVTFLNSDYIITKAPEGDLSCRDIVSYIASLSCSWAHMNRAGQLVLKWFKNPAPVYGEAELDGNTDTVDGGDFNFWQTKTYDGGVFNEDTPDLEIDTADRYDLSVANYPITITGVSLKRDEENIIVGTERYLIEIDNPLIQDNAAETLATIANKIIGLTFLPFTANVRDDPAIDAGDMISFEANGNTYRTILFKCRYRFRNKCQLITEADTELLKPISGQTSKSMSAIRQNIAQKQVQLDALDLAVQNAFKLLAGVWGGYVIIGDTLGGIHQGRIYLSDHADVMQAQKIWVYSLGGIGYYQNGLTGEPSSAWTNDGSIVASLITASMIKAGVLESLNGKSWINMDDGSLSLGDGALKWDAENGFESVAAKKIANSQNSPFFGTIGALGDISALQLVQYFNQWFVQMYGTGDNRFVIKARNGIAIGFVDNPNNTSFPTVFSANSDHTAVEYNGDTVFDGNDSGTHITHGASGTGTTFYSGGISFYIDGTDMGAYNGAIPTGKRPFFVDGICTGYVT